MDMGNSDMVWSVREAKSKLSEVLRRARTKGPQYIGKRDQYAVISKEEWDAHNEPEGNLSTWLSKHSPMTELVVPERDSRMFRPVPFGEE